MTAPQEHESYEHESHGVAPQESTPRPEPGSADAALWTELDRVIDPELRRPITDLGMVESAVVGDDRIARVRVLLTIAGCPMRQTITDDVREAGLRVPGVTDVDLDLGVMTPEQRKALRERLRGDGHVNPFVQPGNLTRVLEIGRAHV